MSLRAGLILLGALGSATLFLAVGCSDFEVVPKSADAEPAPDASLDAGADADTIAETRIVNELPAPQCHDLAFEGAAITPVAHPNDPLPPFLEDGASAPAPRGLYVVTADDAYGVDGSHFGPQSSPGGPISPVQITTYFGATRQYYLFQQNGYVSRYTAEVRVESGRLIRQVLCSSEPGDASAADALIESGERGYRVLLTPGPADPPGFRGEILVYTKRP